LLVQNSTHYVISTGCVISWSDVPYIQAFLPGPASNEKNRIKVIRLQTNSINVIRSVDKWVKFC